MHQKRRVRPTGGLQFPHLFQRERDFLRKPHVILIAGHAVRGICQREHTEKVVLCRSGWAVPPDQADFFRILPREFLRDCRAPVGGAVILDNELPAGFGLAEDRLDLFRKIGFPVVGCHKNRNHNICAFQIVLMILPFILSHPPETCNPSPPPARIPPQGFPCVFPPTKAG